MNVKTLTNAARRAKVEFFWSIVRSCGSRQELERVRAYLETGFEQEQPTDASSSQKSPFGYFPSLEAKPWHDPARLGWTNQLLPFFDSFCQELETIKTAQAVEPPWYGSLVGTGKWNVCYLHVLGTASKVGQLLCPVTTEQTSRLPSGAGKVFLSALTAGTHIKPHHDASNTRLRLHLGLETPPGCTIRVGEEWRDWQKGGFLLFDGSFEHEVWNHSTQTRWVLIMDVWHPDLSMAERRALERLSYVRPKERQLRHKERVIDQRIFHQIKHLKPSLTFEQRNLAGSMVSSSRPR